MPLHRTSCLPKAASTKAPPSNTHAQHGFHCTCGRCVLEQHFFPTCRYQGSLGLQSPGPDDHGVAALLLARRSWAQRALDLLWPGRWAAALGQ